MQLGTDLTKYNKIYSSVNSFSNLFIFLLLIVTKYTINLNTMLTSILKVMCCDILCLTINHVACSLPNVSHMNICCTPQFGLHVFCTRIYQYYYQLSQIVAIFII